MHRDGVTAFPFGQPLECHAMGSEGRRPGNLEELLAQPSRDPRAWLEAARELARERRDDEAKRVLEYLLALDGRMPRDLLEDPIVRALVPEGLALSRAANCTSPRVRMEVLRDRVRDFPRGAAAWSNYSKALYDLEMRDEARFAAHRAVALSPTLRDLLREQPAEEVAVAPVPPRRGQDEWIGRVVGGYQLLGPPIVSKTQVLYDAVADFGSGAPVTMRMLRTPDRVAAKQALENSTRLHAPHASLLRVKDVVLAEDGTPFQLTERVHGTTLRDLVSRGPLDRETIASIGWLLARVVGDLHTDDLFHGCIDLDHVIWVDDNMERRLLLLPSEKRTTRKIDDETRHHGVAADVRDVGGLMYELCSKVRPGGPEVLDRWLPAPESAEREPAQRMIKTIGRCLGFAGASFETAGDIADALNRVTFHQPRVVSAGEYLGEWKLERELARGEGGIAQVWLGKHAIKAVPAAVKVLYPNSHAHRELRRRFAVEASRTPEHPGIVRPFGDPVIDEDVSFFAMELIEGKTLHDYLSGPVTVTEALQIGLQIADAMAESHRQKVFHRDLKPENILREEREPHRLRIIDFGFAKVKGAAGLQTLPRQRFGTPPYTAPEQWLDAKIAEDRADVYSLGMILLRCVLGTLPLSDDATEPQWSKWHRQPSKLELAMASKAKRKGRKPQWAKFVEVPQYEGLVREMLNPNPQRRPRMASVAQRLAEIGEALNVPGTPWARTIMPDDLGDRPEPKAMVAAEGDSEGEHAPEPEPGEQTNQPPPPIPLPPPQSPSMVPWIVAAALGGIAVTLAIVLALRPPGRGATAAAQPAQVVTPSPSSVVATAPDGTPLATPAPPPKTTPDPTPKPTPRPTLKPPRKPSPTPSPSPSGTSGGNRLDG